MLILRSFNTSLKYNNSPSEKPKLDTMKADQGCLCLDEVPVRPATFLFTQPTIVSY